MFTLTFRVLVRAAAYLSSNQVVSVLQLALDRVSNEAQEISSLTILDGNNVVFIARASPARVFWGDRYRLSATGVLYVRRACLAWHVRLKPGKQSDKALRTPCSAVGAASGGHHQRLPSIAFDWYFDACDPDRLGIG